MVNRNKKAKLANKNRRPAAVNRKQPRRRARARPPRKPRMNMGERIGATLGGFAQNALAPYMQPFSHIFGSGDYEIVHNTLVDPHSYFVDGAEQVPMMGSGKDVFRVRHREYLADIHSSTVYANNVYDINPGLERTFPWLASVAGQFEQYKIVGMTVDYISTSATSLVSGTNVAMGTVAIATQYNSLSPPFSNLQQLLNYQFATSCKPSENLIHAVECDPSQTPSLPLYVRQGAVTSGDLRLYDLGQINVATFGSQSTSVIGQLWVSYDLILIKPKLGDSGTLVTPMFMGTFYGSVPAARYSDSYPLGDSHLIRFDNIGITVTTTVVTVGSLTTSIAFDDIVTGSYLVSVSYQGSGPILTPIVGATNSVNITHTGLDIQNGTFAVTTANPFGQQIVANAIGATGTLNFGYHFIIRPNLATQVPMKLNFVADSGWNLPPSVNSVVDIVITPFNQSLGPLRAQQLEPVPAA